MPKTIAQLKESKGLPGYGIQSIAPVIGCRHLVSL